MYLIRSGDLHPWALAHHVSLGGILAAAVKIGLTLMIAGGLFCSVIVRAGIAQDFDQQIALDAQHMLVIHNGPSPTCAFIPNPPQHDCFRPGSEQREFSVHYLTPDGVRSLLWFQLPEL